MHPREFLVNELKLDFDQRHPQKRMSVPRMKYIARLMRLPVEDVKAYRTAHGVHVTVRLREPVHALVAVLLQSLLGSDYGKEAFCAIRVLNLMASPDKYDKVARDCWNVLFYKKLVKGQVVSEEKFDPKLTRKLRRALIEEAEEGGRP